MALAPEDIGARIAKRRKQLGWSHQRLADEMGVQLRTAQRWQEGRNAKGRSTLPPLRRLMELADKMGVERSYFVQDDQPVALTDRLQTLEERVADGFEAVEAAIAQLASQLRRPDAR